MATDIDDTLYTTDFYDSIRTGSVSSASIIAADIHHLVQPEDVLDVGCGEGHWGAAFQQLGARVLGIDGDYVETHLIDTIPHDLNERLPPRSEGHDLTVCLEVAEHLPESRAESFISELCSTAPVVLFSAAIPAQGGVGHVNERWPAYWAELFRQNGFSVSGALRWRYWDNPNIEPWYRQNLLFATARPDLYPGLILSELASPVPLVHPMFWADRFLDGEL